MSHIKGPHHYLQGCRGPLAVDVLQVSKLQAKTLPFLAPMWSSYLKLVCLCARSLQSCLTLSNTMGCSPPGSSVHGILQARVLEWVAMPSSRGSSLPRDGIWISYSSCIGRRFFTTSTTKLKEVSNKWKVLQFWKRVITFNLRLPAMWETWVRKIPWRRKWQPTPVILPGESHGRRSLVGCSPQGRKELDTTERLHSLTHSLITVNYLSVRGLSEGSRL